MSYKGWYNKRDVIRDLAKISGIRHFDENFVVVGEQPPPPRRISDDENETQMLQLYGGTEATQQLNTNIEKPDLAGITHLLRMVDNYDEILPKNGVREPTNEHKNEENMDTVVIISKLNPDVKDFVPTSQSGIRNYANDSQNKEMNKCSDKKTTQLNNGEHSNETNKSENCDSNSKINVSELKQDEIVEMRKQLKHKISDASKTNCVKIKRDRNIAIATLLKLYSQSPNTSPEKSKTLKLIAPNYFQSKLTDIKDIPQVENISKLDNTHDDYLEVPKQELNLLNQFVKKEEQQESIPGDEEDKASFEKVYNWLQNVDNYGRPESNINSENIKNAVENPIITSKDVITEKLKKTPKAAMAFLGPVVFRRKEAATSNSPSLSASDNTTPASQGPLTNAFVPSEYASELSKNYTERAKAKEAVALDIWSKLENELKAKDQRIKAEKEKELNGDSQTSGIE